MTLDELNHLDNRSLRLALERCCGSSQWIEAMAESFPFNSKESLLETAESTWKKCSRAEWKQAFLHHPRIDELTSRNEKDPATSIWMAGEQSSLAEADAETLSKLQSGNEAYEKTFGYKFIICGTGLSAADILSFLEKRLVNGPDIEIQIAMLEQLRIIRLRLEKLLS